MRVLMFLFKSETRGKLGILNMEKEILILQIGSHFHSKFIKRMKTLLVSIAKRKSADDSGFQMFREGKFEGDDVFGQL